MKFSEWLQRELKKRDMDQTDLARRAEMAGYAIAQNSVSRILSVVEGSDACIAIAYGLGVSRDLVFWAWGWLLTEAEMVIKPKA